MSHNGRSRVFKNWNRRSPQQLHGSLVHAPSIRCSGYWLQVMPPAALIEQTP
jgi:hypothetical protein